MRAIHLRTARRRAGLTQEQLEEKSGVAQAIISRLETKDIQVRLEDARALAEALRIDLAALRFGPEPHSHHGASAQ